MTFDVNLRNLNPRRIQVVGKGYYEEARAIGICKPGHLLMVDSAGKVKVHNSAGGYAERAVALENALKGGTIDDAFAVGDVVPHDVGMPGQVVLGRVAAHAAAFVEGDFLVSAGDGTLQKPSSAGSHTLYSSVAASTGVTNTVATEQDFDSTYALPANTLQVGDILHIRGYAVVSAQASTDTLTLKLKIGTATIFTSAAVDSAVGDIVYFDAMVVVRTIGASGTIVASINQGNGVPGTVTAKPLFLASTALDTTVSNTIKATGTWSATNATNTAALQDLTVEISRVSPACVLATAREAVDNSAVATETLFRFRWL